MAEHNKLGDKGEKIAIAYLEKAGYRIMHTNWRHGKAEIDIIASINDFIVFVEVKTRSSSYYGAPEEFVTEKKERLIIDAADYFIDSKQLENEVRFDIVSVILEGEKAQIEHLEDCYSGMG